MPAWITLTAANLADYLVAEQLTALREEALGEGQSDPFDAVAGDVILKVRQYIASNPLNQVDAAELTIPPELKIDTCYLILAPMLGRLGLALTKDQSDAVERAQSTLNALRDRKLVVSTPATPVAAPVQSGGSSQIIQRGTCLTSRDLAGL